MHLDVPPEKAFDVVVDPEAQQSRFMKVEVVKETPEGVGTELRYSYQVLGMRFKGGTYTYSEYVPGKRFTWDFSGGPGMRLLGGPVSSTWTFEPADGGTDLTGSPEFKTPIPVVSDLTRGIMMWFWRRSLPKWKAEIEKRANVRAKS
ncbi:MAG: SRPBCC family protein [Acidimicrobiia bacterium]|nr:SRPBCC family protein [Acidimicrobiia bacterium]